MAHHSIFDHGHRTVGGEALLFFILAALLVTLLYLNRWHVGRRYAVVDTQGRTASRHFTPYAAHRAAVVMNDYTQDGETIYTSVER